MIRDLGDQHVVHFEIFEDHRSYFHQRDYFPKLKNATVAEADGNRASQGMGAV